jgi:glutaredoxin
MSPTRTGILNFFKKPNGEEMRTLLTIILLLVAVHMSALQAEAVMYKWVDSNGVVHFSDTPPASQQEMETRDTSQYREPEPKPASTKPKKVTQTAPAKPDRKQMPRTKKASVRSNNKVEIFTTSWCGYCKKAIALLNAHGIKYKQHDIEKEPQARKKMKALGGRGGVPFAIINDQKIYGFSEDTYKRVLGL